VIKSLFFFLFNLKKKKKKKKKKTLQQFKDHAENQNILKYINNKDANKQSILRFPNTPNTYIYLY
jgi:hypothetical protein